MPLTSKITAYDVRWPMQFETEARRLRPIFGRSQMAIHHVGSTAVPGLVAKPEIDLLAEVGDTRFVPDWQAGLMDLGYRRGADLVAGHHFFKRDHGGVRTHKLHVCISGHPQAVRMLKLRDHLRANAQDRAAYAALKLRLEAENTNGIAEYLDGKAPFPDVVYKRCQDPGSP